LQNIIISSEFIDIANSNRLEMLIVVWIEFDTGVKGTAIANLDYNRHPGKGSAVRSKSKEGSRNASAEPI
jgi:hypothetical protein